MFGFLKRLFGGAARPAPVPPAPDGGPRMRYVPQVVSAQAKRRYDLGAHRAVLLGDIVSAGPVRYEYILAVYDPAGEPCLFVASEVNEAREALGGGSHFLGLFPGDSHANYGDSDEWADMERFAKRAVALAREQLDVPE